MKNVIMFHAPFDCEDFEFLIGLDLDLVDLDLDLGVDAGKVTGKGW